MASLADGGFVIAWVDESTDDIHARRFDSAGAAVGVEFNVDTNIGPLAANLDIEGMDDGRFVITWTESVQTGTSGPPFNFPLFDTDIRSRIYDPRDEANSPNDYDGDQVIGTIGNDTITVVSDDDEVYGFNGNDTLSFANGIGHFNDIYDGGSGTDRILLTEAGINNLKPPIFSASKRSNSTLVRAKTKPSFLRQKNSVLAVLPSTPPLMATPIMPVLWIHCASIWVLIPV